MLETIVNFVDFWVWSLAPTILLLGLLAGFPAAVLIGAIVTGKPDRSPEARTNQVISPRS